MGQDLREPHYSKVNFTLVKYSIVNFDIFVVSHFNS